MIHKQAEVTINQGLSLGARILLGLFATLFGVVMILTAPPEAGAKAMIFYALGAFCLLIAIACLTQGRARQFVGSIIGSAIFLAGIAYLCSELMHGVFWSTPLSEPSAFQAVLYLVFIGYPGASYAYRTGFGFRRALKK